MCGRFTLTKKKEDIIEIFQKRLESEIKDISEKVYAANYNVAPSQEVAVIYNNGAENIFDYHRWGLIPHWAKDKKIGYKMINSRIETIAEKPSFKNSFFFNRCLIIADGYYEWLKKGKEKTPYYFFSKNHELFAFAGIRAVWKSGDEMINSCAIVTTDAKGNAAEIHERMPIILDSKVEKDWLNPKINEKERLFKILANKYNENLDYYQVSNAVNSHQNNKIELLEKV